MRKFTLIALATLFMAVSSYAQGQLAGRPLSQKHVEAATRLAGKNLKKRPSLKSQHAQQSVELQKSLRSAFAIHNELTGKKAIQQQPAALRRAAEDIINEQPAGEQMLYSRSGDAYYNYWGYAFSTTLSDAVGNVVFGADNKVYIKNLVSQARYDTWVEGTLSGNAITIQLPQTAAAFPNYGYNEEVSVLSYSNGSYVKAENQTLKLNYNATTGAISSPANVVVGLTYDDDDSWTGYADYNISLVKNTDPLVEAPAGLETVSYSLSAEGFPGSLVNVGFSGNDVYVQGIDPNLPNTWVKGTIGGDQVTFKGGQYIGADEVAGYHQYLFAATVSQEYDQDYDEYYNVYTLTSDDITFKYDAATKTLTESNVFLINAGKTTALGLYSFDKASLVPFSEQSATPAAPEALSLYEGGFSLYFYGYGWGALTFNLPTSDVNGNYILPEKLSYQLYTKVNGEVKPLVLSQWDYANQKDETRTELPYGYSDNWDIYANGTEQTVYYYVVGPEAYGVQAIYRGNGEEHRSDIVWAEVEGLGADIQPTAATPAYPDATIGDTDKKISYGFYTGEEPAYSITNNSKPETYDVAVKLSDPALVGTLIESITFPLQEVKGVSDISVFLTSQLRVEDGKNAADLVVKSVTPAEAGFITVTLDKPYTIPEAGVYVGYSLTVDDVDTYKVNAEPVAITNQENEGGFYLHTSAGFLKWLDVAEEFGGSALIQVKVAGSSIKSNAVSLTSTEKLYVQAGAAAKVPVTIVNHGAEGVKSIEVAYSVAGQTGTQTADVAISAFLGKSATAEIDIPAISEKGNYELTLNVTKVNGTANEDASQPASVSYIVLNTSPTKHSLLEEYTGFWCGFCPRGYVGVEKLAELYPDDYVLASYHNGDALEIMDYTLFPSNVGGYPDAWLDRAVELDAYYGTNDKKEFGIADDLADRNKQFGHADLTLESSLSDDGKSVEVSSSLTFPFDVANGDYSVEYILIADGLTDESWGQKNYYADSYYGNPLYLDDFSKTTDETVYGLVFNNVVILTSELLGGSGQSITTATADTPVTLQYAFALDNVYNTDNEAIPYEVSKLKVAVLLIDNATGAVVNANKAGLKNASGISIVENGAKNAAVRYFDLQGRSLQGKQHGLIIVKRADGKAAKILVK